MTTITVPTELYCAADEAARVFGSTADRKILKALRDTVKRQRKAAGLGYATCDQCGGLAVEHDGVDDAYRCMECPAVVDLDAPVVTDDLDAAGLAAWMTAIGISRSALARRVSRDRANVKRWLAGTTPIPSWLPAMLREIEPPEAGHREMRG